MRNVCNAHFIKHFGSTQEETFIENTFVPTSQRVGTPISFFILQKAIFIPTIKLFPNKFSGFHHQRLHRQISHNSQKVSDTRNVDVTQLVRQINGESLKAELETCTQFLVDSKMENLRHRVFIFAMEILDAHTLSRKLYKVFEKLNCAAKLNVAFGFVLKTVEVGT